MELFSWAFETHEMLESYIVGNVRSNVYTARPILLMKCWDVFLPLCAQY